MPWWRKAILLTIYGSMILIGLPMAFAWLVVGGKGIIFAAGGFLALFGAYMLWTDFLNPKTALSAFPQRPPPLDGREPGDKAARPQSNHVTSGHEPVASNDVAVHLLAQFTQWFERLAERGLIPRAFTGITKDGKQAIVILDGINLDPRRRRQFLMWLCRKEQFVAYAYGTLVGIADDQENITEGVDLYASSIDCDAAKTLGVRRRNDGSISYSLQHETVVASPSGDGLFFGLQRRDDRISKSDERDFESLWEGTRAKALWRQR